jgi:hypothetical protein
VTAGAGEGYSPQDTVDPEQAAEILGVTEDRIAVMVDEGMLDPIGTADGSQRFLRVDVEAVGLQGG